MKNQREIYEALLSGKKIRFLGWELTEYVCLDEEGNTVDEIGKSCHSIHVGNARSWSIYEEPKKKKKYWSWFIENLNNGEFYASPGLYDENGVDPKGNALAGEFKLIKKTHEDIFIEVEE